MPPGPPVLAPLVAEVYGPDEAGRHAVAKRVRAAFAQHDTIVDIDDTIEDAAPQVLVIRIDQARAALLGVRVADVVDAHCASALDGEDVTVAARRPVEVPDARAAVAAARDASRVSTTLLQSAVRARRRRTRAALRARASARPSSATARSTTRTCCRWSTWSATWPAAIDSPLYGMFAVRAASLPTHALPDGGALGEYFIRQPSDPYRQYAIKWDGEWQITYETFRDMGLAYAVGLVLIYLLVVAQFGSYLTPLIIMAPIPLTIIGVMPGHALLGAQFTATSMIGMIALAGIIVRNSILLVDFINLQVARGVPFDEAVSHSAAARAKPIVLTGLAAMLGALFILDDPIFNGLAISLIFGILVSTLLTLVVIPVLYYAANRKPGSRGGAPTSKEAPHDSEPHGSASSPASSSCVARPRRAGEPALRQRELARFTAFVGANLFQSGFTRFCPLEIAQAVGVRPA